MQPKTHKLRDAAIVPGALNVAPGDVMQAHDGIKNYVRSRPETRNDHWFRRYSDHTGRPTPQSVRIRDMKDRIAALKREGRVG